MTTTLPIDQDDEEKPYTIHLDRLTSDGDENQRPNPNDRSKRATPAHISKYLRDLASELTIKMPVVIAFDSGLPENYALFYIPRKDRSKNDFHLWGHPSGKTFDSILQFAKHVNWLMKRDPYFTVEGDEDAEVAEYVEIELECECKLCKSWSIEQCANKN